MAELFMPPPLRSDFYAGLAKYLQTGEGPLLGRRIEMSALRQDGSEFPVELSIVSHGSRAQPLFTAYVRDITDRKQSEEQLRTAVLREQERAEQLHQADRRKDEFLAMLAHELRNPLAALASSLRISNSTSINEEQLRWSREVMERQVAQLTRLIDDLLDVSRITRGKIKLQREVLPLQQLIERTVDAASAQFKQKRQEFRVIFEEDDPLWVDVDPARVEQILGNLLTNATKYTQEGGRITLKAGREGEEAVLRVNDNGMGIAPAMLPYLFELFAQADQSLDRSHGGLGIGLTLVKSLVEMHGGSVSASSEGEGKGSEFTIRLPLAEPISPAAEPLPADASIGNSKRILVVDDNRDAAVSLAMVLQVEGHVTQIAECGREALEVAERFMPEIVLLDIGLPEMDGYEVARRLRQMMRCNEPLLVATTGYGQPEHRGRSEAAGFNRHLVKPVDIGELLRLCGSPARAAELSNDSHAEMPSW
jgi:signal transduction histidine kinase/CheY-like chemotaxis protein